MVAMNLRRLGVCNKFIQQILRHANVTTTMNIDVKTHSEWHEEPGNDVCNYCATREARQHTNHVEVFLGSSQQISTVDIVTVWRRGGIRTPGTGFSQYNGLANRQNCNSGHLIRLHNS